MAVRKMSIGLVLGLAVTGLFLSVMSAGALSASQSVASNGTISAVNVGIYTDVACTQACTSINWGNLAPGNSTTKIIYIKNNGNIPLTLSMSTPSWTPSNANTYLTLSWDRTNAVLNPGNSVKATLTLTATANAGSISAFSFNIIITGTA